MCWTDRPIVFSKKRLISLTVALFILGLGGLITDDKSAVTLREDNVGKWVYRIVGVYVCYLILQIAQGKDVIEVIPQPFNG